MISKLYEREYVVEESFNAPVEKLWQYFVVPEQLAKWWGPRGWEATFYNMQLTPGAEWRYCLRLMKGEYCARESWFTARCKDVELHRRIVTVDTFTDAKGKRLPGTPSMTITLTFIEHEGATTVKSHTHFETEDGLALAKDWGVISGMEEGWERLSREVHMK